MRSHLKSLSLITGKLKIKCPARLPHRTRHPKPSPEKGDRCKQNITHLGDVQEKSKGRNNLSFGHTSFIKIKVPRTSPTPYKAPETLTSEGKSR